MTSPTPAGGTPSSDPATPETSAGQPVTFREIPSTWGHDSFLLPVERYHATIRAFLDRALEEGLR